MDIEREDVIEAAAAAIPVLLLVGLLVGIGASFVTETPADYRTSVTVTDGGSAAANATVTVTDGGYAGAGEYTTPANGTVILPPPEQEVSITVRATLGNRTAVRNATLAALDSGNDATVGNASDGELSIAISQDTRSESLLSPTGGQILVGALVLFIVAMTAVGIYLDRSDYDEE